MVLQNANDQVVPTMSAPNPIPTSGPRKRRRSTDNLLNDFAQRGISVQQVSSDARQLNATELQHIFRSNRSRISTLFAGTTRTGIWSTSPSNHIDVNNNRNRLTLPLLRHFPMFQSRGLLLNNIANQVTAGNDSRSPSPARQATIRTNAQSYARAGDSSLRAIFQRTLAAQQMSDANRQNNLFRRIRRSRQSSNHPNSR